MTAARQPLGYHPAYAVVDCDDQDPRKRPTSVTLTCAGCGAVETAGKMEQGGTVAAFARRWWVAVCPSCRAILGAAVRNQDPDQLAAARELVDAMEQEAGEVRP